MFCDYYENINPDELNSFFDNYVILLKKNYKYYTIYENNILLLSVIDKPFVSYKENPFLKLFEKPKKKSQNFLCVRF